MGPSTGSAVERSAARRAHAGYATTKRALDFVVATVALVLSSPVIVLAALLIRLESPGPILYRHRRLGRDGQPITVLKFRSMRDGADAPPPERHAEFHETFKLQSDPRVTRVGRLLRKSSIDELPQLVNVLAGSLSMVGPRPIVEGELAKYGDAAPTLLAVKPGITGLWQVSGRSALSYEERVALDLEYARRRSLAFDVWIMIRTIPAILRGTGAV